jgi:hypothetical protein
MREGGIFEFKRDGFQAFARSGTRVQLLSPSNAPASTRFGAMDTIAATARGCWGRSKRRYSSCASTRAWELEDDEAPPPAGDTGEPKHRTEAGK